MTIKETDAIRGTTTKYGPYDLGDTQGVIKTEGGINELTVEIEGRELNTTAQSIDGVFTIPAYSRVLEAFVEVEEAFVLGGTTPAINLGTDGSESTNGVSVAEAQAEAAGVYTDADTGIAINGTWAAAGGFTTDTSVSVALSGTTPTITDAGRARIVVRYVKV